MLKIIKIQSCYFRNIFGKFAIFSHVYKILVIKKNMLFIAKIKKKKTIE